MNEMKDLLKLLDLSREGVVRILDVADQTRYDQERRLSHPRLQGGTLAMIFEENLTCIRVSFETGMLQLGGHTPPSPAGRIRSAGVSRQRTPSGCPLTTATVS